MDEIELGKIAGLRVSALPSALWSSLGLWTLLSALGLRVLKLPAGKAILGGLAAVILHMGSEFAHQLGHAHAAKQTGYPMTGVQFWWLLSASQYPPDEPTLPNATHVKRALGGPKQSLRISGVALVIFAAVARPRPRRGVEWWLALFFLLDNLLVFTLGSFLPLGFTDGSTLLRMRRKE